MSSLLISEPPLQVIPSLAVALKSVDKAIILQQIHYWLNRSQNIKDGHKWVFNTVKEWHLQFPWLAEKTVQRYLKDLCDKGLLITANFNKANFDRTKWYRIDYDALDKLTQSKGTDSPNGKGLVVPLERDSLTQPIPETTHKTTQENNMVKQSSRSLTVAQLQKDFEIVWAKYPNKKGKQIAFTHYKSWRKKTRTHTNEYLLQRLNIYLQYIRLNNIEPQFIMHGSTWFGGRFEDEWDISKPKHSYGQKRVEKGTDWSKKQSKIIKADNYSGDDLKNYFKQLEEKTRIN